MSGRGLYIEHVLLWPWERATCGRQSRAYIAIGLKGLGGQTLPESGRLGVGGSPVPRDTCLLLPMLTPGPMHGDHCITRHPPGRGDPNV